MTTSIESFDRTITLWIDALDNYSLDEICLKPSESSWSLGQLYNHLLNETQYYLGQIHECISHNENADKSMSREAKDMLSRNSFPDEPIEGSPEHARIPQAESKEVLSKQLRDLKVEMIAAASSMMTSTSKGKTKHPGLDFFSAFEWLQFADMHLRHHLRQKARIDNFINNRRGSRAN